MHYCLKYMWLSPNFVLDVILITAYFIAALCNRAGAGHIVFHPVVCCSFFPHLISVVADWMSAILPHMVWP